MSKPKFINKKSTFIGEKVKIGNNVIIYPNNYIDGNTTILDNVILYPNNIIRDSYIKNGSIIEQSNINNSEIGSNSKIGPFARIREHTIIKNNCKIGDFVEVKNSTIKDNTKASHLAYIGDAEIGKNCNIGCGAIFINYNGKTKNKTFVGDNVFIGCNCNIIAPLKIGDYSYICAGTTLTKNTNKYDFVIGRERETIKPNYSKKYF